MSFSANNFKTAFPLFSQLENSGLVYLDNAATTQRPDVVIDAVADFYRTSNANTHRSSHRLARRATEMVEDTRAASARFIGAACAEEIVFTRGATEALNLLANCLTENLHKGDEVVLTTAEHHANLVPWQMAAQRHSLTLKFVPDDNGVPQFHRLQEVLSERTRIVSVTAASNALGFVSDLACVRDTLAGKNITWVVDAAQLAAHRALHAEQLGCDFLVCSAHKFYGPTGIGLLYGKRQSLEKLPPWQGGGEMIANVELLHSRYQSAPHRFETGTSSLAAIAGLNACLKFWQSLDRQSVAGHEQQLTAYLHNRLAELPYVDVLSPPQNNVGIATFAPTADSALNATDLAHWLDNNDIAVRVGQHCAMPLMAIRSERSASVRASLAAYNSGDDVDKLVAAIRSCFKNSAGPAHCGPQTKADTLEHISIEQLASKKGWQQRYRQLMQWALLISDKPEIRTQGNRVDGCESATWIDHRQSSGRHQFFIDSEARVVKGLGALLLLLVNNKTSAEISATDLNACFAELGLEKHLSPSRSNGFRALVDKLLQLSGSKQ